MDPCLRRDDNTAPQHHGRFDMRNKVPIEKSSFLTLPLVGSK